MYCKQAKLARLRSHSSYTTERVQPGFTLVELLVSLGIFMVVMIVATSLFTGVLRANRHAQAKQQAFLALSIAIESMRSTIEFGAKYTPLQNGGIEFVDFQNNTISYQCIDCGKNNKMGRIVRRLGNVQTEMIGSNQVDIEELTFDVAGTVPGDREQPSVKITVRGQVDVGARVEGVSHMFTIQTTVSQLALDP